MSMPRHPAHPDAWVNHHDQWVPGLILNWRHEPSGWIARVRYQADGRAYHCDVEAERLKRRDDGAAV